jgi:hypothetical protein
VDLLANLAWLYWEHVSAEIGVNGTAGAITPAPAGRSRTPSRPREWALQVYKES